MHRMQNSLGGSDARGTQCRTHLTRRALTDILCARRRGSIERFRRQGTQLMETDKHHQVVCSGALHSWPAQESTAINVCRLLRIDGLAVAAASARAPAEGRVLPRRRLEFLDGGVAGRVFAAGVAC